LMNLDLRNLKVVFVPGQKEEKKSMVKQGKSISIMLDKSI
jgi:hypothetical protein